MDVGTAVEHIQGAGVATCPALVPMATGGIWGHLGMWLPGTRSPQIPL